MRVNFTKIRNQIWDEAAKFDQKNVAQIWKNGGQLAHLLEKWWKINWTKKNRCIYIPKPMLCAKRKKYYAGKLSVSFFQIQQVRCVCISSSMILGNSIWNGIGLEKDPRLTWNRVWITFTCEYLYRSVEFCLGNVHIAVVLAMEIFGWKQANIFIYTKKRTAA